ncbi:2-dehydro-3-deoxygluconokinase [Vibrio ruber DSM 16370]|uniref:2-dehydro-3-deoxygluconokinase n=1 Tax=Vibrio ruber (strain DSM 16370 / JCM 11486 / BCRC 17186 / CECT 7878 / LMG 23124 / VR1) TaxID=1123498 RepID=A0A1R4LCT0_VIBR1|nr:aminoimidazole riboside kinase [Vibrio ruber]SJN54391.1 2-dehydro-3-deoxygluconokinase [Vibrio ruber DSM 16370]
MNTIWLTGDAVVDLIPDGESHYLRCPGGAPANVAVAIARLGGKSAFFGRVGLDPMGKFMQQTLTSEAVNTDYLSLDRTQRTSTVVVDLDDHGERSFTFMVKPSADQFLTTDDIPHFQPNEWLHVCSIALANEPSRSSTLTAIQQIKQAGGSFSFDPNLREEVWSNPAEMIPTVMQVVRHADVVKFSAEELTLLTGTETIEAGLETLAEFSIPLIVITLGAEGTLVVSQGEQLKVPSRQVNVVDTTGAGDAFVGGMLCRLSEFEQWKNRATIIDAVTWGNCCGGLATTQKGAMTALPHRHELLELIGS